jgi:hypothetical protein
MPMARAGTPTAGAFTDVDTVRLGIERPVCWQQRRLSSSHIETIDARSHLAAVRLDLYSARNMRSAVANITALPVAIAIFAPPPRG